MNERLINIEENRDNTLYENIERPYLEGYVKSYTEPNREECVICSDNDAFTYRSWIKLGCQHYFHRHCIDIWINQRPTCPLCNQNVNTTHRNRPDRNNSLFTIFMGITVFSVILSIIISTY